MEEEDEGKMGNRRVWVALIHVSSGWAELNWRRATAEAAEMEESSAAESGTGLAVFIANGIFR